MLSARTYHSSVSKLLNRRIFFVNSSAQCLPCVCLMNLFGVIMCGAIVLVSFYINWKEFLHACVGCGGQGACGCNCRVLMDSNEYVQTITVSIMYGFYNIPLDSCENTHYYIQASIKFSLSD